MMPVLPTVATTRSWSSLHQHTTISSHSSSSSIKSSTITDDANPSHSGHHAFMVLVLQIRPQQLQRVHIVYSLMIDDDDHDDSERLGQKQITNEMVMGLGDG